MIRLLQKYLKKLLPLNQGTAYDIDRALIPALIDCSYRGYTVDQDRLEQAIGQAQEQRRYQELAFEKMTSGVEVLHSRRKRTRKSGVDYVEKHGPPSIGAMSSPAAGRARPTSRKGPSGGGGLHGEDPVVVEVCERRLRLETRVLDEARPVLLLHHDIA